MKHLKPILLLILFTFNLNAATRGDCPTGANTNVNPSGNYSGSVTDGINNQTWDSYSITIPSDGTLSIDYTSTRNTRLWFTTDSSSNCRNNKILDSGQAVSDTLTVTAGQIVYIQLRELFGSSNTANYDFDLSFIPSGCDNSLDTAANNNLNGTIITGMHNILTDTTDCISGYSDDNEPNDDQEEYYQFTVAVAGTLNIARSSPNGNSYHLKIGSSPDGNEHYGDTTSNGTPVPAISLSAGDTVYIYMEETGTNLDVYQLDFDFVATPVTGPTTCPGMIIPNLNATSVTASNSFTNVTVPANTTYYYHFTPTVAGTIQTNSSANRSFNSLFIYSGSTCGSVEWSNTNDGNNKSSPEISVNANETIVIAFQRRHTTSLNLSIDFTFTKANNAPTANAGPNQTILLGNSITLSGTGTDTDGSISSYQWSEGATILSNSASFTHTPLTAGSHIYTLTVTDDDGDTGVDTVTVQVNEQQVAPVMNAIPLQNIAVNSAGNTINLSSFVTLTNGDPIISYTLGGDTLPSGMSFSTSTGIISGTPTEEGDFNLTAYATDNDGDSNTVLFTLRITPAIAITNGYRDFNLRYQQTLAGKMLTVGNTVLVAPNDQDPSICNTYTTGAYQSNTSGTSSNAAFELCAYHADSNVAYGTTRAQLPIPVTGTKIVWAGLYWQALVDNAVDVTAMQIKMKHENTTSYTAAKPYQTVDFDTLDYSDGVGHTGQISYSAFADVTSYFEDNNLTGGYITVGDIPIEEGKISSLGTYGAWTIVVIYEDTTEALQNFSIYDGWKQVDSSNANVNVDIAGFYTPSQPANLPAIDIVSSVSVFAAEGDKHIANDSLTAQPSKKSSPTTLTHTSGQTFNSSVVTSTSFARLPNPVNNQGIDIQEFNLGTSGYNIMETEEDSIRFVFSSNQDRYWPSMIAFATELYVPEICYDYTVKVGDYVRIDSTGQNIDTRIFDGLPINIQFAIRSEEADFIYFDTKARIVFTGGDAGRLSYDRDYAQMSPPTINTYFKIASGPDFTYGHDEIESNASIGQIAVGANVIDNLGNDGGLLKPGETTYGILGYDVSGSTDISTHFDFIFNSKIQFDPTSIPVEYIFNTSATVGNTGHIPRCPTNAIYDPIYMQFNVERVGTQLEALSSRYTLHTQVTGRPYQLDITSYTDGNRSGGAHTPQTFDGTVELEWIDAGGFQNSSAAGYDLVCDEPQAIGEGSLVSFAAGNTESRHTIDVPTDFIGYDDTIALQSAALRLWVISVPDDNGTRRIISHQYTNKNNNDFSNLYNSQIKDANNTLCDTSCPSAVAGACYECLKIHYAFPVCSRDNFSIRPASYHINILDDGDDGLGTTPVPVGENKSGENNLRLSAGYDYNLEVNATNYLADTLSQGYYAYEFAAANYETLPDPLNNGSLAAIDFNDLATCYDKNNSTIELEFLNGSLKSNTKLSHNNAGLYQFWLADSDWTAVDQANSGYKPIFDGTPVNDCVTDTTGDGARNTLGLQAGCTIYSINGNKLELNVDFFPYKFNLDDVNVTKYPDDTKNYSFFNDFSNSDYYDGLVNLYDQMSVSYVGKIIAQGKDGTTLTNFTTGCSAQDLNLTTNILTNPTDVNNTSPLQMYLQYIDNVNPISAYSTDNARSITLPDVAFENTVDYGEANILLHTTFAKPKDGPIDPVISNYKELTASSPDSYSSTDMVVDIAVDPYVPDGNNSADRNITYYFAKVTPSQELYDNVAVAYKITPIYVDIYCTSNCAPAPINLTLGAKNGAANWYSATMFDGTGTATDDGTTDLSANTVFGEEANPSVTPNDDVTFDDINGSQNDINVTVTGAGRPSTVNVSITPVPWLRYDSKDLINGYPYYRVRFIGNSSWVGVGNTGQVIETTSNTENTSRMNW